MRSNSRHGVASVRKGSSPKIRAAIRPLVDALERRLLLSGTLPSFVQASTDASYTLDNSSGSMVMDLNSGSLVVNSDLSTATGWSNATVRLHNSAHVYFNSAQTLGDLELHDHSTASDALGNTTTLGNMLKLNGLAIDSTAALDLGDNAMILHYVPAQEAAEKSLISGLLQNGYAKGAWTGTGINSSAAANDPTHNTALGWFDQNDLGVVSVNGDSADFADGNEIAVKYTVYGDTDLSGNIDATDSANISLGLHGAKGWGFGDFNYDGYVNSTDTQIEQTNAGAHLALTNPQYTPTLKVQVLPFTAYGYSAWSGDVATFYNAAQGGSTNPSDYSATVDWNNGTQPIDAQVYKDPLGNLRVNIDSAIPSDATVFTVRVSYAPDGYYQGIGAAASASAVVTLDQLPINAIASADAIYTVNGTPGAMQIDVTAGTISFNTNLADDGNYWQNAAIDVSGSGHLIFNSAQTLGSLAIADDATVTVSQGSGGNAGNVLQLNSISVSPTATLDLGDNSMILYYAPSDESNDLSTVRSLLTTGYNGGAWNGPGIDSSAAANDATHFTSVGWLDNNLANYSTFAGVALPSFDEILVRYTIAGDADLSGVIDGTDLSQAFAGQSGQGTGWMFGDFNYNGTAGDQGDFDIVGQDPQGSIGDAQYAPAFNLSPLPVQPDWQTPFDGDIATFTDTVNTNLPASDYLAEVYWGDGSLSIAQVTATSTPGSFRINAVSPVFTSANPVMLVTLQYSADSGYQSESAIAGEPIEVLQLPPGVNASANAVYSISGGPGNVQLNLTAGSLSFDTNVSKDSNYFQNLSFTVSGSGHAYFNSPENFNNLSIQDNATVSISRGGGGTNGNLLDVQSLSIDPNATLDLTDNALIDWYAFANESAASTQMSNWLTTGYKGGAWTGPGIDSSVAAADLTHTTGIGWMDNGFDYSSISGLNPSYSSFLGVNFSTNNQLLVRFTVDGDANLNGQVDNSDVNLWHAGFVHSRTEWVYGNFNYDAQVDDTDLAIFDANYGLSATTANYAPAFQPAGILINPTEGVPFSGDLATFTDILNPTNADPSIYVAQVNWGDGDPVAAQVTATSTPGSFRINAVSPPLTDPNAVMTVTIHYADMNDPSPTYQGRPAAVSEPILFAPGAPTSLTVEGTTDTEVDLSWIAPTGPTSASLYTIYRDGVPVGTTKATAYADTGLEPGTAFTYTVSAQSTHGASNQSAPVTASTTNVENLQPPAPPSSLATTVAQNNSVTLTWTNSAPNAAQLDYEITRNGVQVTTTNAGVTSYIDSDTIPNTIYTYSIAAYDPSQSVLSSPANAVVTTGGDTIHPGTPPSFTVDAVSSNQVTLSWVQPADNVGVTAYVLSRSGTPINLDATQTTYTDTVSPGGQYSYSLYAKDGSGNLSFSAASVSVNLPSPSSSIDQSPNQYVPDEYVNYFYNTLVKSFRQLNAYAGYPVTGFSQQLWYDAADTNITTLPGYNGLRFGVAANVYFHDHNGNKVYDPGESVWIGNSIFSASSALISGPQPPIGAYGIATNNVAYVDKDGNGLASPDEIITTQVNGQTFAADIYQLEGVSGKLAYDDVSGVGYWTPQDPIWVDQNNNSEWDPGETVIYQPSGFTLNSHQWGKKNGLNFYDLDGSGTWKTDDPVWFDSSDSFRQDFAAFYGDVDSLIPSFINSDDATSLTQRQLTLGSVLAALNESDWTKIPAGKTSDGVTLTSVAGAPDANSAIFPEQFQELHYVLSQLTTLPGIRFDQTTSDAYNSLAATVISYYTGLFGTSDPDVTSLEQDLQEGDTQPGGLELPTYVQTLQSFETDISGAIYARQGGNWVLDSHNQLQSYFTLHLPNFADLPSPMASGFGQYSMDVNPYIGPMNTYMQDIIANGMWTVPTGSIVSNDQWTDETGYRYTSPPDMNFLDYPELTSQWTADQSVFGNTPITGSLGPTNVQAFLVDVTWNCNGYPNPDYQYQTGIAEWAGFTIQLTMPDATNKWGGSPLTELAVGPTALPGEGAGWTWGNTYTRFSVDESAIEAAVLEHYPTMSDVDYPNSGNYLAPGPTSNDWASLSIAGEPNVLSWQLSEYAYGPSPSGDQENQWGLRLQMQVKLPVFSVYGLAPSANWTFTPLTFLPLAQIPDPPTDPIPLQSQMNEFNVVQDTNLDGIVQVDHDQTSFGNDTGSMNFEMERNMPQVYIPLNTDGTDGSTAPQLPIHAYLSQGGFGASQDSVGTLLDQDGWNYSGANENGEPFAYSLDTSVRNGAVIIDTENHLKRIEVIRPQGNAVLFDFPWNKDTGQFSAVGHPLGIDSQRLYVLRDLTPDDNSDFSYELLFPSGITQTFDKNTGHLLSVGDTTSGLSASLNSSWGGAVPNASASTYPTTSSSTLFKDVIIFTTPRYNISVNWAGGTISKVTYVSNAPSSTATIATTIQYDNGNDNDNIMMTDLEKAVSGGSMPPASYSAEEDASLDVLGASDGFKITEDDGSGNGRIVIVRSDKADENGNPTVTITKSVDGTNDTPSDEVEGTLSETGTFNANGLITDDSTSLSTQTGSFDTLYTYQSDSGYYANGAPKWGKITDVTNPDGSWANYAYDPNTGWLTDQYTPYKSSLDGNTSGSVHAVYDYNAADSGNGDGADPNSLVALPRETTTSIGTTVLGVSFARSNVEAVGGPQEITRQGSSAGATWATAFNSTTTSLKGYDSYTLIGPLGTTTHTGTAVSNSTTQTAVGGAQLSSQNTTTNAFGGLTGSNTSNSSGIGQGPTKVTPGSGGTPDPFGRTSSVTVNASNSNIRNPLTTNYSNYGWLGPQSVTDPTGQNTTYTYTPTGQIATATIYPGGAHSVTTTYTYDAAGNVIKTVQQGTATLHDGSTQTISVTTSATYDVLGRLLSSTDALGRTTNYIYTVSSTGTTVTETLPDGSTQQVQKYALDGMLLSTTGSAVADPSTGDEGVVTSTLNEPGNITIPAGSTWTLSSTNNGSDWTKIYTNLLGQQFYTQQSGPNGVILSTYTTYDGNGRPITFQDVDGSVTHTDYNPADDSVLDTWVDMNGNGVYDPGVDSKTVNTITKSTTDDTQPVGTAQKALSASGNQQTTDYSSNSGLDTQTTSNGLTTSTHTELGAGDGNYTVTTTNPDGTRTVDTYAEGLLTQEQTLGTSGTTAITTVSYYYDALRRNIEVDDWTGTTTFQLRDDGSVQSMTLPDGRAETINAQDANTQLPTEVTRLDGKDVTQSLSPTGQTTSQGIGDSKNAPHVTPSTYQYDPLTGKLASLTLFPTGSSTDTTGQEITGFKYDPATGLESKKTYADGSTDTFTYNNKLQLSLEGLRGGIDVSFNYNKAGMQTGATYTDYNTESKIQDSLGTLDDLGRSHVMTELTMPVDGPSTSTSDILNYNPQGQVASEAQASGVTVKYDYNIDSSIEDMKLMQGSQTLSETDYAYDPISKRLASMTIDGIAYTFAYKPGTNLISSVLGNINPVAYSYEDKTGRLSGITAFGPSLQDPGLQAVYSAGYTYTANDQRLTEHVLQQNPDTQAIDERNWTFNYDDLDQLASVTDDGTTLYSYPYDAIGNRTDAGSVNTMNQYASFHYNGRGDVTDDGTYSYTWDAKDRLIAVEPDSPNAQSQKDVFTYDPENRRTQEDIFTWDAANQDWVASSTLKFVYNGSQMVAELNGQNQLLQSYAWGPDGRLLSITDYTFGPPTNYQVVTDGSGSVVELLNSSTGLVAASYQYDPWGNPISATGPAANVSPFRWQGEFYDANFGGYYMGAREGSARLHIFLSPDPSGEGSDPNLYRMVGNDPINNTDPTGLRFTTLLNLLNKVGTFANEINDPALFVADHGQAITGLGTTAKNMVVDAALHPAAFHAGEPVGVINAGVKTLTGPPAMLGHLKAFGERVGYEALGASDQAIDDGIASDREIRMLTLLDRLRQQKFNEVIQSQPRAFASGATFGGLEFNAVMLLPAAIDLPAALDSIGEGIAQFFSWISKFADSAEAATETASLLSDVQNFSAMRNYDYPLPSSDIGPTGFVRTTTPWQRTVIERPGMIDWNFVRPSGAPKAGLTNFEAARLGWAPGRINPETGSWDPVALHHILDDPRGPVMQTWLSDHSAFHQIVSRASNPWRTMNPAWADAWSDEVPAYWQWRTGRYNPPVQSKLWLPGDPR